MSQVKFYDYYITDEATATEMKARYACEIEGPRKAIHKKLLADTGAVAWTERNNWGGGRSIYKLVYSEDHEIAKVPYVKKPRGVEWDGKLCVALRGKLNSKAGIEFNNHINNANDQLKDLPAYKDWLVKEFGIMRTCLGGSHEGGRGTAMLDTYGGNINAVLGFAIPNGENDSKTDIALPECFTKITYGKWHDLLNETE